MIRQRKYSIVKCDMCKKEADCVPLPNEHKREGLPKGWGAMSTNGGDLPAMWGWNLHFCPECKDEVIIVLRDMASRKDSAPVHIRLDTLDRSEYKGPVGDL